MTTQPWLRLYRETIFDPKLAGLPAGQRWVWITLLCLSDDNGVVELAPGVPYSIDQIAAIAHETQTEAALDWFERVGMIRRCPNQVIGIVNWGCRQFKSDTSKDRTRKYQQRQRDESATSQERHGNEPEQNRTHPEKIRNEDDPIDTGNDNESGGRPPQPGDYDRSPRFLEFWQLYPNKADKLKAHRVWIGLSEGHREAALSAIPLHANLWSVEKRSKKMIPHPTTWLNGARWEDEIEHRESAAAISCSYSNDGDWICDCYRKTDQEKYENHPDWGLYTEETPSWPPRAAPPFTDWLNQQTVRGKETGAPSVTAELPS